MRNREQIYGQEAAELLRNITVYHCMRRDQLLRLYPGKEGAMGAAGLYRKGGVSQP